MVVSCLVVNYSPHNNLLRFLNITLSSQTSTQSPLGEYWMQIDEIKLRKNVFDYEEDGIHLWNYQI